jgi:hypothetical protein
MEIFSNLVCSRCGALLIEREVEPSSANPRPFAPPPVMAWVALCITCANELRDGAAW